MATKAKHTKVSSVPDGPDSSLVRPSDWNADHAVEADGPGIIGRTAAGAGAVSELDASTVRTFLGLGTAALVNTGTSGATIPLLNGANTHSGNANFTANVGFNQSSPQRRVHLVGTDGSGGALPTGVGAKNEVVYENNGNGIIALVGPESSVRGVSAYAYGRTDSDFTIRWDGTTSKTIVASRLGLSLETPVGQSFSYNTNTIWHAGNQASVQAGLGRLSVGCCVRNPSGYLAVNSGSE